MADNLSVTPGSGAQLRTTEAAGVHTPHHHDADRATLMTAVGLLSTSAKQDLLKAVADNILTKLIAAPATEGKQDAGNASLVSILAKMIAAPATEAKQDLAKAVFDNILTALAGTLSVRDVDGGEYKFVAAGATNTVLGASGAVGDYVLSVLIIPTSKSPGPVSIKDGTGGTAMTIFAGGTDSLSNLVSFAVPLGMRSAAAGGWFITTGTGVSVIATGNFT